MKTPTVMSSVTPYSFYLLISEFVVRLIQRVKVDEKKPTILELLAVAEVSLVLWASRPCYRDDE